jgi:hypothetical protein
MSSPGDNFRGAPLPGQQFLPHDLELVEECQRRADELCTESTLRHFQILKYDIPVVVTGRATYEESVERIEVQTQLGELQDHRIDR